YRRIGKAFSHLEREVAGGRIRAYGVSSNTFGAPADDPKAISLTRLLAVAREVAGDDHHFRIIQCPLNLLEPEAAVERNNGPGGRRTALEEAAAHGVGVLVNRPLNAFWNQRLVRLADFETDGGGG